MQREVLDIITDIQTDIEELLDMAEQSDVMLSQDLVYRIRGLGKDARFIANALEPGAPIPPVRSEGVRKMIRRVLVEMMGMGRPPSDDMGGPVKGAPWSAEDVADSNDSTGVYDDRFPDMPDNAPGSDLTDEELSFLVIVDDNGYEAALLDFGDDSFALKDSLVAKGMLTQTPYDRQTGRWSATPEGKAIVDAEIGEGRW